MKTSLSLFLLSLQACATFTASSPTAGALHEGPSDAPSRACDRVKNDKVEWCRVRAAKELALSSEEGYDRDACVLDDFFPVEEQELFLFKLGLAVRASEAEVTYSAQVEAEQEQFCRVQDEIATKMDKFCSLEESKEMARFSALTPAGRADEAEADALCEEEHQNMHYVTAWVTEPYYPTAGARAAAVRAKAAEEAGALIETQEKAAKLRALKFRAATLRAAANGTPPR